MFDPEGGAGTPAAALVAEMNAYLDSLGVTVRLGSAPSRGTPPDVQFGCRTDASDECLSREEQDGGANRRGPTLRLAVGRPSSTWVEEARATLDRDGVGSALLITLEVGQYWTRQKKGWRGDKEVQLGTGYSMDVPWLTSLDAPVVVLQLTGALVDRDGRALRIGAEGLFPRRTNIVLSGFGVQALLSDEDVERVRTMRREDLPGRPLVWQVALRNLVAELAGRPDVAVR